MTEPELARDLSFLEAYTLGLGTMIGAGIFVLPGIVAGRAGPASMLAFLIGGIVALLAALSLSELATGMPKAGGSYYYVNRALGGLVGSVVGWGMWGGLMFASAFYMLGFGQYLLNAPAEAATVVIAALVMSTFLVGVNYRGVKETGSLQNVIVITLVGLIVLFIVTGMPFIDPGLLQPFAPDGWGAVGLTAGTVFVAFIGFEVIATSAEEIKAPSRNLPLSMIAAVVTPTILYVFVMLVSTGILPVDVLEASSVPVADVAREYLGSLGFLAMILGAILATVSSANASILSAARVNFAMGRDKLLSDWLNQIHLAYRTPYRAILATGAVILLLIVSPLPIATLADVASFMFLITYALVHISVIVLRRAEPEGYDPDFRIPAPLYPAVPILGFFACLGVMLQMRPVVQGIGILIVIVGVLWFVAYARDRAISTSLVGEAIATEEPTDEIYRVVIPIANPETERTLIRYGAASAAAQDGPAEVVAVNVIEVPPQTSPSQIELEETRIDRQRALLESARETAETLDVPLRTRAMVGRDAGRSLLSVIEEENADHVLLGWTGTRRRREVVFGSTVDQVVERARCDVTLVRDPTDRPGSIVVLAGEGANAPVALRRAVELDRTFANTEVTLLNVQSPVEDPPAGMTPEAAARANGEATIAELADRAGVDPSSHDLAVFISEDVEETLLETVGRYDTVCIGATGESFIAQALYGTLPQRVVRATDSTIVMARGPDRTPRTFRQAIIERLTAGE